MDGPRDERLAGARFPGDQNWKLRVHDAGDETVERLHRRGPANQRQVVGRPLFHRALRRGPALDLERAGGALHQVRQVERLWQVVEGVGLGGLDRRHDRVLRRDHDHRQARPLLGDLRKLIQTVAVGHDHVRDDEIALPFLDPPHQRDKRRGGVNLAARPRQRLRENRADRAVVIGDQNRAVHCY